MGMGGILGVSPRMPEMPVDSVRYLDRCMPKDFRGFQAVCG